MQVYLVKKISMILGSGITFNFPLLIIEIVESIVNFTSIVSLWYILITKSYFVKLA